MKYGAKCMFTSHFLDRYGLVVRNLYLVVAINKFLACLMTFNEHACNNSVKAAQWHIFNL